MKLFRYLPLSLLSNESRRASLNEWYAIAITFFLLPHRQFPQTTPTFVNGYINNFFASFFHFLPSSIVDRLGKCSWKSWSMRFRMVYKGHWNVHQPHRVHKLWKWTFFEFWTRAWVTKACYYMTMHWNWISNSLHRIICVMLAAHVG